MSEEVRQKARVVLEAAQKVEQLTRELRVTARDSVRTRYYLDDAVEHAKELTRDLRWVEEVLSQRDLFGQGEG